VLDGVLNVVFYIPLGAAAFLALQRGAIAFTAAVVFGTLVSFSVEWVQLSIPTRFGNLTDLFCNSVGTLVGVTGAMIASSRSVAPRLRALHAPGILLVGLWTLWQASALLLHRSWSITDAGHEMVGLLLLVVLAARRRFPAKRFLLISMALWIWLVAEGLRPMNFEGPAQPFGWLPFESWFVGAPEAYYGTFFMKLFFYTAILWVERKAGMGWIRALLAPGAILFATELAQRYLPGRTPEITDVVLLGAGAMLLQLADSLGGI
jgi:glycopeptide antibiotics resistance protein